MKNYVLYTDYPSSCLGEMWRDALPSGNGEIGASVYGGVHNETIMFTHNRLWWKAKTPSLPDVSDSLPKVRQLLLDNKPFDADTILSDRLTELGYDAQIAVPLPLCDISLTMHTEHAFSNYKRYLDMQTGEITVSWTDGTKNMTRKVFVSRSQDIVALNIKETSGSNFNCDLKVIQHDTNDIPKGITDFVTYLPEVIENDYDGEFVTFICKKDDGETYGAVAKYVNDDGQLIFDNGAVTVKNVSALTVLVKVFVGDISQVDGLKQGLKNMPTDYTFLLQEHTEIHNSLLTSATLDLFSDTENTSNEMLLRTAYKDVMSLEMVEKMWLYGRYLLISSSKEECGLPCHLYGLWCGSYEGLWAFNMANENIQMMYWHALSGNMPSTLMALFDYVDSMMDDFKTNAKNLYGCRGIFIPAPTTPESGLLKHVYPHIIHFTAAAAWIAQHYFDYYLFTLDKDFLKHRALPFMEQVALFYEDFLIEDEHGFLMVIPSNSPENTPSNYWQNDDDLLVAMETTINATIDIAVVKELLTNIIRGSELCGCNDDKISKWETMLSKLPRYEINEDGALKEWIHDFYKDNYHHRHQSHIYPFFPGSEIREGKNTELYEATVKAIDKRLVIGLHEQTGWSLAHMANVYARMKNGDSALDCLNYIAKSCVLSNFFTVHNDWRNMGIGLKTPKESPVQLDANMGFCSAINEMLLQSYDNTILILPALPTFFSKGEVKNLCTIGNIKVSILWDTQKKEVFVTLLSPKDSEVVLVFPSFVQLVDGKPLQKDFCITQSLKEKEEVVLKMTL